MRNGLLLLSLAAVAGGVLCLLFGVAPPAYTLLLWGALLFAAVVYERFRYKPLERTAPGGGWERTNEKFVDTDSGKTVTVYVQRETGERQYVEE